MSTRSSRRLFWRPSPNAIAARRSVLTSFCASCRAASDNDALPNRHRAARSLHLDAVALLERIVEERLLQAIAAVGFWPANRVEDDIELYTSDSLSEVAGVIH